MTSSQAKTFYTPEEYLEFELNTEQRNEYFQGEILAMEGAKIPHVILAGNVAHHLKLQLDRRCKVLQSDLRVHVPATGLYTYPDVTVVFGEIRTSPLNEDTVGGSSSTIKRSTPFRNTYWSRGTACTSTYFHGHRRERGRYARHRSPLSEWS